MKNLISLAFPVECGISSIGKHKIYISFTDNLVVKHLSCDCSRRNKRNAALMVQALEGKSCVGALQHFRKILAQKAQFQDDPYIYPSKSRVQIDTNSTIMDVIVSLYRAATKRVMIYDDKLAAWVPKKSRDKVIWRDIDIPRVEWNINRYGIKYNIPIIHYMEMLREYKRRTKLVGVSKHAMFPYSTPKRY